MGLVDFPTKEDRKVGTLALEEEAVVVQLQTLQGRQAPDINEA